MDRMLSLGDKLCLYGAAVVLILVTALLVAGDNADLGPFRPHCTHSVACASD